MWRGALVAVLVACAAGQDCTLIPGWGSANTATTLEPVLDPHASGFFEKDMLTVVFHNPKKFNYESATLFETWPGAATEQDLETVDSAGITGFDLTPSGLVLGNPAGCYSSHAVRVPWGDYSVGGALPYLSAIEELAQRKYRGRVRVTNNETLADPVRNSVITRAVISELVFEINFPKQVAATFLNVTAWRAPAIAAALIFQEVEVNIHDFDDVDITLRVFTSVQWPFRVMSTDDQADAYYHPRAVPVSAINKIDMATPTLVNVKDCLGQNEGDVCEQVWEIKGNNKPGVCDLDGTYRLDFKFDCHFLFDPDCPLVPDDLGYMSAELSVDLKIDTEYFCPVVVDNIELAGTLDAFKDELHITQGNNFQLGAVIFFRLVVTTSSDVSIKSAELTNVIVSIEGTPYTVFQNGIITNAVEGFEYSNGFETGPGASGFKDQIHFNWLLTNPPFNPPEDGAMDIDVVATANVEFEGNSLLLAEVAAAHPGTQRARFGQNFKFNEREAIETLGPSEVETAGSMRLSIVGSAAATAAVVAVAQN